MRTKKNILLVEDNEEVREELNDILIMENYHTIKASDGKIGLQLAIENIPDLIISDVVMPDYDGFTMYKYLQDNVTTERIPVVFLSAKATDKDIRKGMNMGGYDYLTKPVSTEDLLLSVKTNLQKIEKSKCISSELKTDLSCTLSHELRTPLNSILGFSEYLAGNHQTMSYSQTDEFAKYIYSGAKRLAKLTEDLLLFSELKIEKTSFEKSAHLLKREKLDTKKCIEEVMCKEEGVQERINDIALEIDPVTILFNKRLYEKIVSNVLNNALKFSKKGNQIKIKSKIELGGYIFEIFNEGIGLNEEHISEIDSFTQFDRKKQEQQGAGLGLATIMLIAELAGVDIHIDSCLESHFLFRASFNNQ